MGCSKTGNETPTFLFYFFAHVLQQYRTPRIDSQNLLSDHTPLLVVNEVFLFQSDSILQVSKKYVSKELSEQIHKKADPFIKWLKEAEEETSDEEEDEVELEFDDRAKISTLQVWHIYLQAF